MYPELKNNKMPAKQYKRISGRLQEHYGFKLSSSGNVENADKVYCIHCEKSFSYHGSNTSLTYHLQTKHPLKFTKNSLRQPTAASTTSEQNNLSHFFRSSDRSISVTLQHDIKVALVNWIAGSGRPISIVDDDGLQRVLRTALKNAEYKLPSRGTIQKLISDMYNTKIHSVKESVKNAKGIALTSDFWTSLGNENYCGVTGHWITDDWKLKSVVLQCVNVVERHYSDNIAGLYKQFTTDWDITNRIQAIVTDNARNMVSAVQKADFAHIPCLAHSIQLSILHGFKAADTEPLFEKCRKIVGHFKHSAANTTELQNCTESSLRKLQQDVPTRWNSIFTMLQSLLHAREALAVYMSNEQKQYKGARLTDLDWEKISKYIKVLDIFCEATVLLGGQDYVSCSCVLPMLSSLTKHMTIRDDDPGYIAKFKDSSIIDFNERVTAMPSIEMLQVATALDPRYKLLKCLPEDAKVRTWSRIEQKIQVIVEDDHTATVATYGTSIYNNILCEPNGKRIKLMESDSDAENVDSSSDELMRYKMEMKVHNSVDPLQWWKLNEHRYPKLSLLAKTVLCIPATSVPCERLFSSAGYIVNKTRSSLEPNNVNTLVCLRSWLNDDI